MEVFVNQEKIGDHTGSYTLYRVDVTDQIVNGDNELDIVCDSEVPCLDASLIVVGKHHFSLDHFGDAGLTVIPQEISTSSASIRITAHAKTLPEDAMISYTVLTTTGTMLANKSVPVSAPEYICHLTNPCLWNGKTSPKLYVVVAGLIVNGATEDQIVLPFGLRNLSMESNGSVLVNGLCVPEKDLIRTLESDPFVYDDMDEDGSFACVELKELCDIAADEEDCKNLLTEYVLQNAYHPSHPLLETPGRSCRFCRFAPRIRFHTPGVILNNMEQSVRQAHTFAHRRAAQLSVQETASQAFSNSVCTLAICSCRWLISFLRMEATTSDAAWNSSVIPRVPATPFKA